MMLRRTTAGAGSAVLIVIALLGCKTVVHTAPSSNAPMTVEALAAAIAVDARRSDLEPDAKIREQLSADAGRDADACLARAPMAAACLYYHAIALGLQARAHPLHAADLLKTMLESLTQAETADKTYDHAGPARVRALVLVKAPGWPVGPGDPDAGLASARHAVEIDPGYAPNLLALAGALSKTGDTAGARRAYEQARAMAMASTSTDRDDWMRQADQGLHSN